ncbi:ectoine hydroxylase-related dioxygenase (phytanoyl-CoA dioxygenase family) [Jatrophihabitans sp. GAS493]|uniref:phytanoyl-CoA dioxygenase family protein n=1 Tax=Jatrophihabitans sp. GAS493 TaxID=1907575 RepID=UPI000BB8C754|nr:phytanoyl-CoA dioxygenase family protein [Jatrophihabitans sp. GAS493]SOD72625.1 ectoine hydroxylase-related dioxygenase (phytanoyl-CoA dioxygenase family) [Jatrophihabitans sp. GAS493]
MTATNVRPEPVAGLFETTDSLAELRILATTTTELADYPLAESVEQNVLIYAATAQLAATSAEGRRALQLELAQALLEGPGIVVFRAAIADRAILDRTSALFESMIREQHAAGLATGDHFAKPGANDRIWGALDKFALRDPELFAEYYANDVVALAAEAWLGPNYQVVSQVNVVNPGGAAQVAHRDYHLGFMSSEQSRAYPAHTHQLTPALTLQGAIAHCDMPVVSGPTMYLPHSQKLADGYLAFHRPEVTQYFNENYVQLPLQAGDAVFFNPALFHGAGSNHSTNVKRMANLLQISSAFGRAMETVNRPAMCRALLPILQRMQSAGVEQRAIDNIVAATAEGYAFPTNLDRDRPINGLAPLTQAELLSQAVRDSWGSGRFSDALATHGRHRESGV